jgi:hypothetical protein
MNATDPVNSDALNGFTDGVAERVTESETAPFVVFGPRWAQEGEGAGPPPEGLSDPVWASDRGWMEKDSAPIQRGDGGPLAMYAPDSMDELDTGK